MNDGQSAFVGADESKSGSARRRLSPNRRTRDPKAMELRRRKGMRMLATGIAQADVARELKVSRQTASSWAKRVAGNPQAWRSQPLGRRSGLTDVQKKELRGMLLAGAAVNGFPSGLWTLARVGQIIEREFGLSYSTVNVWRILKKLGFRHAV